METRQIQTLIPKRLKQLESAIKGDIVSISEHDDRTRYRNHWAVFLESKDGKDKFIVQHKIEDINAVAVYSSERQTHQYDEVLGVILSREREFILVGPQKDNYTQLVDMLKNAELWVA
ncbi:MAG: hypothetical protein AABW91_01225 [Nanoarchaeota archaeon]